MVQSLQRTDEYRKLLDEYPVRRIAYYYLRAWAISRGIFSAKLGYLSQKDIVTLLQSIVKEEVEVVNAGESLSYVIRALYGQHGSCTETPTACLCKFMPQKGWHRDWFRRLHQEIARAIEMSNQQEKSQGLLDWGDILSELETEPLQKKLVFPCYLRIKTMYLGNSRMAGGKWLSMIEENLLKLKQGMSFTL